MKAVRVINAGMLWAFTEDARVVVLLLVASGVDFDLAVAVLEKVWTEDKVYDIGDRAKITRPD